MSSYRIVTVNGRKYWGLLDKKANTLNLPHVTQGPSRKTWEVVIPCNVYNEAGWFDVGFTLPGRALSWKLLRKLGRCKRPAHDLLKLCEEKGTKHT